MIRQQYRAWEKKGSGVDEGEPTSSVANAHLHQAALSLASVREEKAPQIQDRFLYLKHNVRAGNPAAPRITHLLLLPLGPGRVRRILPRRTHPDVGEDTSGAHACQSALQPVGAPRHRSLDLWRVELAAPSY